MRDIRVLAQIKLNLTTVDQFLAIACGLADDNLSIKDRVYGAAKETRSSALLIDHLRNLFSHQQSIEAQQAAAGHQQFHQVRVQYQTETSRAFGTNHQQQQQQQELNFGQFAAPASASSNNGIRFLDRAQFSHNSQLFTYSNQLTLVRAAKCLVANVAKILYLTDTIVLRNTDQMEGQPVRDSNYQQQQQLEKQLSQNPALSDRLDNVANYSQLLRCFGELSTELVDLGHCIMFSEHHKQWKQQQQPLGKDCNWLFQGPAEAAAAAEAEFCRLPNGARRNSHQGDRHPSAGQQQQCCQQYQQAGYYPGTQLRPSASSTSMLQAAAAAASSMAYQRQGRPAEPLNGFVRDQEKLDESPGGEIGGRPPNLEAADWLEHTTDNQLVTKIQDMQTLFQVNRLIIDRSILLLLSASKCCLRQGSEYLRGLEARQSIVVQIRASISIIMAIVKCSIFGAGSPKELPINAIGIRGQQQQQVGPTLARPTSANLFSNAVTISSNNTTNSVVNINSSQIDNQFDNYYYLACLSPFRAHNKLATGAKGLGAFEGPARGGLGWLHGNQQAEALDSQHKQQQAMGGGQAAKLQHCAPTNLNLTSNKATGCSFQQPMGGSSSRRGSSSLEWPLQIMNYFLQTWNGAQSAHDAISKLQLLVRPFARVSHYKDLFEALNGAIDASARLQATTKPGGHHRDPSSAAGSAHSGLCDLADDDEELASSPAPDHRWQLAGSPAMANFDENKENQFGLMGAERLTATKPSIQQSGANFVLMNRRQFIAALNSMFLGELKANLIERAHEFTDCAYTRHEHRETIMLLINCIKMQLNKLAKLLYRLRRKSPAINELNLGQLRQLATQLDETFAELKCELQTIVIEQSDELDKFNSQLDLIKQLKHHCLVGDFVKANRVCSEFHEQSEQLVEVCKMLNQVSPTNKMKISTKTLAIWFELNMGQLLNICQCLAENNRSRVLKDCAWAYIQVWCSFYDDFCQLARQLAYLTHAQYDTDRALRVAALRGQMLARQSQLVGPPSGGGANSNNNYVPLAAYGGGRRKLRQQSACGDQDDDDEDNGADCDSMAVGPNAAASSMAHAASVQSLNMTDAFSNTTDSPRSLDHYYGFGANYSRGSRAAHQQQQQEQQGPHLGALSRQSASPRLGCYRHQQAYPLQQQQQQLAPGICENLDDLAPLSYGRQDELQQQQHFMAHHGPLQFAPSQPQPAALGLGQQQIRAQPPTMEGSQVGPLMGQGVAATVEAQQQQQRQLSGYHQLASQPSLANTGSAARSHRHHHHHHHRQSHHYQQQQAAGHYAREAGQQQQPAAPMATPLPPRAHRSARDRPSGAGEFQLAPPEAPLAGPAMGPVVYPAPPAVPVGQQQRQLYGGLPPSGAGPALPAPIPEEDQLAVAPLSGASSTEAAEELEQLANCNNANSNNNTDQQSSATEADKWSDSDADAIVRGARETAQMALSMYQFTKGEGDLNTTQDLFTQAELFAEEANELYKEVRCFSYKVPAGDLKKELLAQLGTIPALVQQLQFIVKNPTVGKPATFAKVDSVIRETRSLMEAVNRVVTATLSCRQHYNMAIASMRKRTRTLSPSYRGDKGFEFENHSSARQSALGGRHGSGGGMGSEPDI